MLKRNITYENFNGEKKTGVFYFNLTKAEIVRMEVGRGLRDILVTIVEAKDNAKILEEFETLILAAYGVRTEDGERFVKTKDLRDEFRQSAAYDQLFIEMVTDEKVAADFINGVIPKEVLAELSGKGDQDKPALPPQPPMPPIADKA